MKLATASSHCSSSLLSYPFFLTIFAAIAGLGNVHAADAAWTGTTEVTGVTRYIWRGYKLAAGSIQPSIVGTYDNKFTLGYWGSYAIEKNKDDFNRKYNESDLIASYLFLQKDYTVTVGGTIYHPDFLTDPDTGKEIKNYFEAYASIALNVTLSPTLSVWQEFGPLDTTYVEFSLNHSFELDSKNRLTVRPIVEYSFSSSDSHYFGLDLSITHEFGNSVYGRASVLGTTSSSEGENIGFGLTIGMRF